jgi:cell division protein FtsN
MSRFKQRGGTFLGLILGAIIGLAVALAVAVYVAKVPMPFLNKNAPRANSGQDAAAEAEKNKGWDPNAPLRNRGAVRSADSAATPASGAASALMPAEVNRPTDNRPAAGQSATAARPGSSDPLGDFVTARVGAQQQQTPAAAAASTDPFIYFVQAGAYRTPEDAEAQRARLSLLGVQASVSEGEQAGRPVYRVRVGPLQNRDAADRVKDRLDKERFDAALVRVQR